MDVPWHASLYTCAASHQHISFPHGHFRAVPHSSYGLVAGAQHPMRAVSSQTPSCDAYAYAHDSLHTGIMLFRKRSLPFVEEWVRVIEADDKIWDQNAFNDLARRGQVINPDDPNHYFTGASWW